MRQKQSLLEGAHPVTSEVLLLHHALLWYRFVTIANAFEMKDNEIMAGGVKCHFCNNIKCQRYKTGGGMSGNRKIKKAMSLPSTRTHANEQLDSSSLRYGKHNEI